MAKRRETTLAQRQLIINLYQKRSSQRAIADLTDIPKSTVGDIIKKFKESGNIVNKSGRGRKSSLSERQISRIVRDVKKDRRLSAPKIAADLKKNDNIGVVAQTVRNCLHMKGFKSRTARKKPYISPKNRRARLAFAQKYISEPKEFWRKVIWSDESKYNLFGSDGHEKVWRKAKEELRSECIRSTVKYGGGSVMVWGCMSAGGVGLMQFIDGIMTKEVYLNILRTNLAQSVDKLQLGADYLFQHDNDPKHTAKIVGKFFEENGINTLKWPSQSPDLNPIEHLWDKIERKLRKFHISGQNGLRQYLEDIWNDLDSSCTRNLVESMPRRLEAVIKAKGGPTKY